MTTRAVDRTTSQSLMIEAVRRVDPFFATTMERAAFESVLEPVSFWKKTALRTIAASTGVRTIKRAYADDGEALFAISRPSSIYAINAREGVELSAIALPEYARFFVTHAGVGRGIRIIEHEREASFVEDKFLGRDDVLRKREAMRVIRPMVCTGEIVSATAIRALDLVEVAIKVAKNGVVEALTTVIVVEDVPVLP
jgi:hypothetical protein